MKETEVNFDHETGAYQKILLSELDPDQNPFQNYSSMTKLSYDHVTDPKILRLLAITNFKYSDLSSFLQTCDETLKQDVKTVMAIIQRGHYDKQDLDSLQSLYNTLYKKKLIMRKKIERELEDAGNLHTLDDARRNKAVIEPAFGLYHDLCLIEAICIVLIVLCENEYNERKLETKLDSLRKLLGDYYGFYEMIYKGLKDRITTAVDYQTTPLYFLSDHITSALTHSFFKTKHYKKDLEKTKSVDDQLKFLKRYGELEVHDLISYLQALIDFQTHPIDLYIDQKVVYLPKIKK